MRVKYEFLLTPNSLFCSEPYICLTVGTLTPPIYLLPTTAKAITKSIQNLPSSNFANQPNQETTSKFQARYKTNVQSCLAKPLPHRLRPWLRPLGRKSTSSTTCLSPSTKWAAIPAASTRRSTPRLSSFLLLEATILRGAPSGKKKDIFSILAVFTCYISTFLVLCWCCFSHCHIIVILLHIATVFTAYMHPHTPKSCASGEERHKTIPSISFSLSIHCISFSNRLFPCHLFRIYDISLLQNFSLSVFTLINRDNSSLIPSPNPKTVIYAQNNITSNVFFFSSVDEVEPSGP